MELRLGDIRFSAIGLEVEITICLLIRLRSRVLSLAKSL